MLDTFGNQQGELVEDLKAQSPEERFAPTLGFMQQGEDPKGWDRASITLKTHPLHPMPNVTPQDLILPNALNKTRLVLDCLAIGGATAALVYFPLMLIGFMSTSDQSSLIFWSLAIAFAVTAVYVFVVAILDERAFRAELEA
jgi:hypothetical protein